MRQFHNFQPTARCAASMHVDPEEGRIRHPPSANAASAFDKLALDGQNMKRGLRLADCRTCFLVFLANIHVTLNRRTEVPCDTQEYSNTAIDIQQYNTAKQKYSNREIRQYSN